MGTRQSALAVTQTGQAIELLQKACAERGLDVRFATKKIVTKGDRILDVTLSKVGGKGLFVKELEQALYEGEIDIAIHSMKDVPAQLPDGLVLGAVLTRADPRDCVITRDGRPFAELPQGAKVGTSSLRRSCQLKASRPDLQLQSIRGNIDSRLRKLASAGLDAVVLAAAGLIRMGWEDRITERLPVDICLPAVGQGALAIECRADDREMLELLKLVNDQKTQMTVAAERAFLNRLDGGCQIPLGAFAEFVNDPASAGNAGAIRLTGMVGAPDGSRMLRESAVGADPIQLGTILAERLIERGADDILAQVRG